ncbi:ABC transporter ATP-binding protein [Lachnospiraceae bacterium JLR.KK009]|jgi:putative ABC transport system ATP-binding protein|nr:hypothetical protein C810_02078 [Lachnospiraceae bacterium A2]MCI8705564.1 ABC transporter ATP-binding protein [Lachnospiraceae bacterium]MCI8882064.1 ABC transporter ATP-binding protein [Lachnospiraceae bacterium]
MSIAVVKGLNKIYRNGEMELYALADVELQVEEGEFVAIVGTSGSGKSTLMNILGGLDRPTEGSVRVGEFELTAMSQDELTVFRRRNIGFIFQNYNLIPVLNVYENMILPLKLDGVKVDQEFAELVIQSLGLEEKVFQLPNTLSGGQQQRVAIARALLAKPALILADEPTGSLDSRTGMEVIGLMKVLSEKFHQTLVVVTHNEEIAQLADRMVRIEDGKIFSGEGA